MSTQLSPQIRVFAIVGVLLIALAGGGLVYLQHSKAGSTNVAAPTTQRVTTPAATTASTTPASTSPSTTPASTTPAATTPASTTASTTPTATTQHQTAPATHAAHPVKVDPNLPLALRTALQRSRTVVVALYNPHVRVGRIALGQVQAGAAEMHVGFLRVNVLDDKVAGTLTALLPAGDVLPNPGFLVYRRPGKLVFRFDGYLDQAAIAQVIEAAK